MAEGTRSKNTEELVRKTDSRLNELVNQVNSIEVQITSQRESQANFEKRLEVRFEQMLKTINESLGKTKEAVNGNSSDPVEIPCKVTSSTSTGIRSEERTNWPSTNTGNTPKKPKIVFPSFDGNNPRNWIRKCKKYFNIHPMDDDQKLDMVSIHMEGKADTWFHDYQESNDPFSWDQFVIDVSARFLEVGHDNIVGEFNKLVQKGTVEEYQENFE